MPGLLVAVLASPPTTQGQRTRSRVELVRQYLDADEMLIVNLFPLPTHRTTDISRVGKDSTDWLSARSAIEGALSMSSGVLLAYGVGEPTGVARHHHRRQVEWLRNKTATMTVPVYQVGDGPRHPSRWQRWTSREHFGKPFLSALELSIIEAS